MTAGYLFFLHGYFDFSNLVIKALPEGKIGMKKFFYFVFISIHFFLTLSSAWADESRILSEKYIVDPFDFDKLNTLLNISQLPQFEPQDTDVILRCEKPLSVRSLLEGQKKSFNKVLDIRVRPQAHLMAISVKFLTRDEQTQELKTGISDLNLTMWGFAPETILEFEVAVVGNPGKNFHYMVMNNWGILRGSENKIAQSLEVDDDYVYISGGAEEDSHLVFSSCIRIPLEQSPMAVQPE